MGRGCMKHSSLLHDLVFYSTWQGRQCLDAITGKLAIQSATPVPNNDETPFGEGAGVFTPSTNNLTFPSTGMDLGDIEFSIGVWVKPTGTTDIIKKTTGLAGGREYDLCISNVDIPNLRISADGTNNTNASGNSVRIGAWNCLIINHDPIANRIVFFVNGTTTNTAHSNGCWRGSSNFEIGADFLMMGGRGSIGPIALWKRMLTEREQLEFYNNGRGLKYPFGGRLRCPA